MNIDLHQALQNEFKNMTVEEVQLAIKHGIDETEKLYTLNSKVLRGFVKTWKNTKKLELNKAIAIKNKKQIAPAEVKTYNPEEQIAALEEQFSRYTKQQEIYVFVYPFLENFGKTFTPEEKFAEIEKAVPFLIRKTHESATPMIMFQVKARIKELEASTPQKPHIAVINQAQRQLLEGVFEYCMSECLEIEEYFEELKNQTQNTQENAK